MGGSRGEWRRPAVEVVGELITAVSDGRIEDLLALTDPEVVCRPATRPGLTVYEGHDGMARLVGDLSLAYGRHRIEVDDITADTASQVTARTRVIQETDRGDVLVASITSVYTLREGMVTFIDGEPGTSLG